MELELIKDMICFRLLSGVGSFLSLCCGVLDFEVLMQSALTSMPWEGSEGTDNPLNVVVPGCHPLTLCWDAWDSSPQLFAHCSGTTHVIDLVLYNPYLWVEAHLKKKKSHLNATRPSENVSLSLFKVHSLSPQPYNVLRLRASCPLPEVPFANIFIYGHLDFLHFFVLFIFTYPSSTPFSSWLD